MNNLLFNNIKKIIINDAIQKNGFIMVTRSQKKLKRTIRILEKSVELSSKETYAKSLEKKYKKKINTNYGIEDYPIQSLKNIYLKKTRDNP